MKLLTNLKKNRSYVVILLLTVLYALLLSANPVGDAYSNAFASKSGEDMFSPHHLLYAFYGNIILKLFGFLPFEPMTLLQLANAVVAGGCLLLIRRMLKRIHHEESFLCASVLFCGASFGFMRFATDNECYIVPLFFCLLSIYYLQVFLVRNSMSRLLKAAVAISFGCLFHQLSVIAWLCVFGVIVFNRNKKYPLAFFAVSLIVPICYFVATFSIFGSASLSDTVAFALTDYINGTAQMPQAKQVVLLSLVSLVRTFVQLHGYMFEFAKSNIVLTVVVLAGVTTLIVFAIMKTKKNSLRNLILFQERRFVRMLWVYLILTFGFAAFSNGNAEFMIAIPFILVLLYSYYFSQSKNLLYLSCAMLLWNVYFGLYPQASQRLTPNEDIAELCRQNPNAVFVLKDKNVVENIYLYKYGKQNLPTLYREDKYSEQQYLKDKSEGKTIITDLVSAEETLGRAKLTSHATFDFSQVKNRQTLFEFSSCKCKRTVCKL